MDKTLIISVLMIGYSNAMDVGTKPLLCYESCEGHMLKEQHCYLNDWQEKSQDDIVLLPKTNDDMLYVYSKYLNSNDREFFFFGATAEIHRELKARLLDENVLHINTYLAIMKNTFSMFKTHKDQNFAFCFFNRFGGGFYNWIISMEDKIEEVPSKFKSENLIRIVKSVSDMLEDSGYFKAINDITLFESYKQLHLTGEYWQSEEGQNMINAVTGALSEGFSLK